MSPKISDLVKALKDVYDKHGDIEVVMSHDNEGNAFSKFDAVNVDRIDGKLAIVLWPDHEEFELHGS